MQPIIFSHGFSGNRMTYSALCMELASCGYIVVCISHDDKSGMFTPLAGPFQSEIPLYTFDVRKEQVKIRENEVLALADEIMSRDFMKYVSLEWKTNTLSRDLVLMGHSYGGITVLAVAADCKHAKAVITLDPWFYPYMENNNIGAADHQKSLILMTELLFWRKNFFRYDVLEKSPHPHPREFQGKIDGSKQLSKLYLSMYQHSNATVYKFLSIF